MSAEKVEVRVSLPIIIYFDGDDECYYAESPHFDLVRHGATIDKAIDCFMDAFEILATYKLERGDLGDFLGEAGYYEESILHDDEELVLFHPPGMIYPRSRQVTDTPESVPQEIHLRTFPEGRELEECRTT